MSSTVIVGAGISGLALAHALRKRSEGVVVLEAGARAGGKLGSERRNGYLLENGPNSYIDRDPAFRALIDELKLGPAVVHANPEAKARYVVHRGRLQPLPLKPQDALRTPLLSVGGKLRALAEPIFARRSQASDETLEEFGVRHLGREATANLLDAMQTGIYAGRIDELSAASTFPQLVGYERESRSLLLGMRQARKAGVVALRGAPSSFAEGMGQLAEALGRELGDGLHLDEGATGLERSGSRWTVRTARGEVHADQVVLATHPSQSAALLRSVDAQAAESLASIPHAPMVVVQLGIPRERIAHPLDGFGFLVPAVENRRVLGCIFSSALFAGRAPEGMALLTVLLGGRRHPELVGLDDRSLTLLVRDELRALMSLDAEPELVNVVRHGLGIPQYVVGHRARMETIAGRLALQPGLHLAGWGYDGVGVLDAVAGAQRLAARLTPTAR